VLSFISVVALPIKRSAAVKPKFVRRFAAVIVLPVKSAILVIGVIVLEPNVITPEAILASVIP